MREVLVGFDSALADNPKIPGAICALVFEGNILKEFYKPLNVGFSKASEYLNILCRESDYVLVAIDQPIIVSNQNGSRPCERVAATLISRLKGGVQPARRSGGGARFFGDDAAIWRFLESQKLDTNAFAAKYNPANRSKFNIEDWKAVCQSAAALAYSVQIEAVAGWLLSAGKLEKPSKYDQDQLDAMLCLLIGFKWRYGREDETFVIGCGQHGYILSLGNPEESKDLSRAAIERGIPFNVGW